MGYHPRPQVALVGARTRIIDTLGQHANHYTTRAIDFYTYSSMETICRHQHTLFLIGYGDLPPSLDDNSHLAWLNDTLLLIIKQYMTQ